MARAKAGWGVAEAAATRRPAALTKATARGAAQRGRWRRALAEAPGLSAPTDSRRVRGDALHAGRPGSSASPGTIEAGGGHGREPHGPTRGLRTRVLHRGRDRGRPPPGVRRIHRDTPLLIHTSRHGLLDLLLSLPGTSG